MEETQQTAMAALYLRSSKDRSDVSIAAQRHELERLAQTLSLTIVQTFEDVVESGSSEDRAGFIDLTAAVKNRQRGWVWLLVYDTSRIARRRYIAQAIKHQAKKHGVTIRYARLPADLDPVSEVVLESVFEAFDEAHSIMSRQKGLAGMAQNVRQGWRAGGRAPVGYTLEAHATGAIREGKPVTKSKLILSADAQSVSTYLKARAIGTPRGIAVTGRLCELNPSSLVGMEWNALTYAGHTVWNVHREPGQGTKRRPRSDWLIHRDTHPALISDAEAEAILAHLETSNMGAAISRAKAAMSEYLLTGLLWDPEGQAWVAHGRFYRLRRTGMQRGKLIPAKIVDQAVIDQLQADQNSELYLRKLLNAANHANTSNDRIATVRAQIKKLEREKQRAAQLALSTDDAATFTALVGEKGRHIAALEREAAAMEADDSLSRQMTNLTIDRLKELLADQPPSQVIEILVDRVILEPNMNCRLVYKAVPGQPTWLPMASPTRFELVLPP